MTNNWPTKEKDLHIAEKILEAYAVETNSSTLGLFEICFDAEEKRLNFRLSSWVITLAEHFKTLYGTSQGDFVTRKVISRCLTNGETLH